MSDKLTARTVSVLPDKLGVAAESRTWQHAEIPAEDDCPLGAGSAVLFSKIR